MSSYFPFLIMRNIIYSENSESIHAQECVKVV